MAALNVETLEPAEFVEGNLDGASVWLSVDAIRTMLLVSRRAGRQETGGILIGRYSPNEQFADVVEASLRPKGSLSGWFWFQRSKEGLASLLADRWRSGYYYLGEWHFHPGAAPDPSGPDVRAMQKISRDPAYHCEQPLLIILGGNPEKNWSLSATLFRSGQAIRMFAKTTA